MCDVVKTSSSFRRRFISADFRSGENVSKYLLVSSYYQVCVGNFFHKVVLGRM